MIVPIVPPLRLNWLAAKHRGVPAHQVARSVGLLSRSAIRWVE